MKKFFSLSTLVLSAAIILIYVAPRFSLPYWTVADNDTVAVTQPLYLSAGYGQTYFDHTAYPLFLFLTWWHKLLSVFGWLTVRTFDELRTAADLNAAFQAMFVANRAFSYVLAVMSCLVVGKIAQVMSRSNLIGFLAVGFAAAGGAVAIQSIQTRSELLSASALMMAIFAAIKIYLHRNIRWQVFWTIVFGFFVALSMMAKILAIVMIVFLPFIVASLWLCLPGKPEREETKENKVFDASALFVLFFLGVYLAWQPISIFMELLSVTYSPGRFLVSYHFFLLCYIVLSAVGMGFILKRRPNQILLLFFSMTVGACLALQLNEFYSITRNYDVLLFFKEYGDKYSQGIQNNPFTLIVWNALRDRFSSPFNFSNLWPFYLSMIMLPIVWKVSRQKFWAILTIFCCGLGIEILTGFRYPSSLYKIYSDFLFILTAVIAVSEWMSLRRNAYIVAAASAIIIVISVISNVKRIQNNEFSNVNLQNGVSNFCFFLDYSQEPMKTFIAERGGCPKMLGR